MLIDSKRLRDLKDRFRGLWGRSDLLRLTVTLCDRQWDLIDGPRDTRAREQLHKDYRLLVNEAAEAAGAPEEADKFTWWHNCLKDRSPYFHLILQGNRTGGYIQNVAEATADYCDRLVQQKDDAIPTRLRRDQYPRCDFLYDNSHEPQADPKAELDSCKARVWRAYDALIDNLETRGMAWADPQQKLEFAVAALSFDLAVLHANYIIDRGMRGDEAMHIFRGEAAELLEEVTSSWRASCDRLAVTFEDDIEEVKNLAQPFHRVRDDLRRLLRELPAETISADLAESECTTDTKPKEKNVTGPRAQVDCFIEAVLSATGRCITRTNIWSVAGYRDPTQFERFQRNQGASRGSIVRFNRILNLPPAEFIERLDKLTASY
jgi:hypothetical protein